MRTAILMPAAGCGTLPSTVARRSFRNAMPCPRPEQTEGHSHRNAATCLSRSLTSPYSTLAAAIAAALLVVAPLAAIADQPIAATAEARMADVSLADLNLSSPEGMRTAHDRLQAMAQRVCAEAANGRDLSSEPNFAVCVQSTLAAHLKQINALGQNKVSVRDSVTRAANVSLRTSTCRRSKDPARRASA